MFDVGFSEMLLIALVALLVFGPKQLPTIVREITFWVRKIRGTLAAARAEIEGELQVMELREAFREQRQRAAQDGDTFALKPPAKLLPRPPGLESPGQKE
jgi:sec-independent protein translocase protein TatB